MTTAERTMTYPLIWTEDVAALTDWAVHTLGLYESWRAPGEDGTIEHSELHWRTGRISINIRDARSAGMGPAGIALALSDQGDVDAVHVICTAAGGNITQPLAHSTVAYGFTVTDPVGNQWWVHAETGFLDEFRTYRS